MFAIAVNRKFVGKMPYPAPEDAWKSFNGNFTNEHLSAEDLITCIQQGFAFTTHHHRYRKAENFTQGQHIALDFDTEDERSTLEALAAHPFISSYATFLCTTPSHTTRTPRARVVFLLDRPIRNVEKYTLLAHALVDVIPYADKTCKDATRFYFGAVGCEVVRLGNILTLEEAGEVIVRPHQARLALEEQKRKNERQALIEKYGFVQANEEVKTRYINAAFDNAEEKVKRAGKGERHHALLRQSRNLAGFLDATWVPTGAVNEERIRAVMLSASIYNGEVKDYGQANSELTIRDGILYGRGLPWEEPVWRNDGEKVVAVDEDDEYTPSQLIPDVTLTAEQAERERQAIDSIYQTGYWKGYHDAMTTAHREMWGNLAISNAMIDQFQLGYNPKEESLTIPYLTPDGTLSNIEYYDTTTGEIRYAVQTPSLFCAWDSNETQSVIILDDSLAALRSFAYAFNHQVGVYGLPNLPVNKSALDPILHRHPILLTTAPLDSERIAPLRAHVPVVRIPIGFTDLLNKGMNPIQLQRYLRQAV